MSCVEVSCVEVSRVEMSRVEMPCVEMSRSARDHGVFVTIVRDLVQRV
jgi:hypothetical protein